MVKDITEWILNRSKRTLADRLQPSGPDTRTSRKQFPVNLAGWRYRVPHIPFDALMVSVTAEDGFAFDGEFRSYEDGATLDLRVPKDLTNARDDVRDLVEHELQHLAQVLMEGHGIEGGRPPRKSLTPEYPNWMYRFNKPDADGDLFDEEDRLLIEAYEKLQSLGIAEENIRTTLHDLVDAEFYPLLQDNVRRFQRLWKRTNPPERLTNEALRVFVGERTRNHPALKEWSPNPFFTALRIVAPAKYRVAVKELFKAVTPETEPVASSASRRLRLAGRADG